MYEVEIENDCLYGIYSGEENFYLKIKYLEKVVLKIYILFSA